MIPEIRLGESFVISMRSIKASVGCIAFCMCALLFSGCASSTSLVKNNLNPQPLVANAISKAMCLGSNCLMTSLPAKKNSFPPIPLDEDSPAVKKFIREYAYGQRGTMKQYLAQAEQYLPMVRSLARENGVPEDIAYLFLLESGANPEARSPANALGMWQFMPATARNYGLRVDSWVDERLDPRKSTQAALLYLKDLYGNFGCWRLALSAYNSGENKLNNVMCQENAGEYDDICDSRRLKRETREFVPRFQAIAHIAKNADRYGFRQPDLKKYDEPQIALVSVDKSFTLDRIATSAGIPREELAELNPALVRNSTPPDAGYSVRVPLSKKNTVIASLKKLPEERSRNHVVHVIKKGDTVATLVKRYGVKKHRLAGVNPDVNFRKRLKLGSRIVIPVEKEQTAGDKIIKRPERLSADMTNSLKSRTN